MKATFQKELVVQILVDEGGRCHFKALEVSEIKDCSCAKHGQSAKGVDKVLVVDEVLKGKIS